MTSPDGRLAAVRRLEETALGSRALQRLAELVVRLLGASSAQISLLGDAETVVSGAGPATVLTELDRAIEGLAMRALATAAIARVEQTPEERAAGVTRLRWSNAGHPPPLVRHPDGRVELLTGGRPELMLGVDPSAARTESVVTVERDATLLLYTDGLVEGRDMLLDEGIARLQAAVTELATGRWPSCATCSSTGCSRTGCRTTSPSSPSACTRRTAPRPPGAGPRRMPPSVPLERA